MTTSKENSIAADVGGEYADYSPLTALASLRTLLLQNSRFGSGIAQAVIQLTCLQFLDLSFTGTGPHQHVQACSIDTAITAILLPTAAQLLIGWGLSVLGCM